MSPTKPHLFESFFQAGFECSTHKVRDGRRLDLIASTRHDELIDRDYQRMREYGMRTVREGIRWHLIETQPYYYDWSSVLPMIRSAREGGMQVIWDLFHYGWPDDLDIFAPEFVTRFGKLAEAFAQLVRDETDGIPFFAPVNEPSFVSWGGGDAGFLNPFSTGRDGEIKAQLVRAIIAAIEAIRGVDSSARIVQCEPAIHITAAPNRPEDREAAEGHRRSQFQALDMLTGKLAPELGGGPEYLDILGLNFYYNNEWFHNHGTVFAFQHEYQHLNKILREFRDRYERPVFVSETGIEGEARAGWLAYICAEVRRAIDEGVAVEGICLYPILNHPGWGDDRHCYNGMFEYANAAGHREVFAPMALELECQQAAFEYFFSPSKLERERQLMATGRR